MVSSTEERAQQIRQLIADNPGIQQDEIAARLGVTRGRVSQIVAGLRGELKGERQGRGVGLRVVRSQAELRRMLNRYWMGKGGSG